MPPGIALIPSAHHQLFTQSWQPSAHPAKFEIIKDHQCNAMGKTVSCHPYFSPSQNFDITLLMTLLRNICGLAPPVKGWDVLPAATDTSCEADIARFKYFRNEVYARGGHASVDDSEFHRQWKDIRDTLVRLGGVNYEVKVCYYSCCCCCFFSKYKFLRKS